MRNKFKTLAIFLLTLIIFPSNIEAQYFGRNKARYESFDFKVYKTPSFEFYYYLKNQERLDDLVNQSEQWCAMHQHVLKDTLSFKNPFILYNDHPDFQQTSSIPGSIGVGTGGVTEAFKNRIVLPIAMSNQQTNHVIGHEMVHAFQYNMILRGDSTSLKNLANLPLWMVEGLAEYLSIGRSDSHTAMWMRDAVLHDNVPKLKDLNKYHKYFPYRWGQVFWAFLTSIYGDDIIEPFFVNTAKFGFEAACKKTLGVTSKQLSETWQKTLKEHFGQFVKGKKEKKVGNKILSEENAGRINISPILSPDGKYLIFLSEKDVFGIDLFLADVRTGKILKKITSTTRGGHYDDFNYIESAGTWSPDSKRFAFSATDKGQNVLVIKNAFTGKTESQFEVKNVPAFTNPIWSPDGKSVVVTGLVQGQIDLYQVDLKTKKVTQLTNNIYTELLPNWSTDGKEIIFSTDQLSMENGKHFGKWTHNLAILNLENQTTEQLDIFPNVDNMNPVFNYQNEIYFTSNRNGYRNLYKYNRDQKEIFQMTEFMIGISGITPYAPAISVSKSEKRNRVVFTQYLDGKYTIYAKRENLFSPKRVDKNEVNLDAAMLPKMIEGVLNLVDEGLNKMEENYKEVPKEKLNKVPYRPKFKLDYVGGGGGIGVGTSQTYGTTTGLAGAVDLIFSDILGKNKLYTTVAVNGEIYDFGAQVAYLNQKRRIGWGIIASHIPNRTGLSGYLGIDTLQTSDGTKVLTDHYAFINIRTFQERIGVFGAYPFSPNLRVELASSYSYYSNRADRFDNYYDVFGRLLLSEKQKIEPDEIGYNLFEGSLINTDVALVGDNSFFGLTAPLAGYRYRIGADQYFGDLQFSNITIDLRKYFYLKPFSFAFKGVHYGRYGKDADIFFPFYLGSPWYMRGLDYYDAQELLPKNGKSINNLFGNKMLLTNFEVRIPLTGPEQIALIKSGFLFSDFNLFLDGGMVWYDYDQFNNNENGKPEYLFTTGVSWRINFYGALILEPYYGFPLLKKTKGTFGLNIIPGW